MLESIQEILKINREMGKELKTIIELLEGLDNKLDSIDESLKAICVYTMNQPPSSITKK
jgi:hypothetical protein